MTMITLKTSSTSSAPSCSPWIEKYRPTSIKDISSQSHITNVLTRTIQSNNLPHLLFYGPPGTGKTSTILALARDLYGPDLFRSRILELNASDERGIQVVRDKIKNFARTVVSTASKAQLSSATPPPPYKIIILDEADSMTPDAQAALRRLMETYANVTRFCLICNYVTRIIDPLASRCAKFRFTSLNPTDIFTHLRYIADAEKVAISDASVHDLIAVSHGDMRKAIMYLQSLSLFSSSGTVITTDLIHSIAGIVPAPQIKAVLDLWHSHSTANIDALVNNLVLDGWSVAQLVSQLYTELANDPFFTSVQKSKLAVLFAQVELSLINGASEFLQLFYLVVEGSRIVF